MVAIGGQFRRLPYMLCFPAVKSWEIFKLWWAIVKRLIYIELSP